MLVLRPVYQPRAKQAKIQHWLDQLLRQRGRV
jgi:hypothetical protein